MNPLTQLAAVLMAVGGAPEARPPIGPETTLLPVPFTAVQPEDAFWSPRIERIAGVTIPHCLAQCEATGRLANFEAAARALEQRRSGAPAGDASPRSTGYFFNDSDVYKLIEGAANILATRPDAALEAECDRVIAMIAAAQEPDGYLYTSRTILDPANMPPGGADRWSDMEFGHELYCAGHLYEAAIAYHAATGKRSLLDVAIRNADLVASVFGPGRNSSPCGHPEIELALVRLADATGDPRYLQLARFFLDTRGRGQNRHRFGEYSQDHAPITEQTAVVGHAVRAAYLYSGLTDVGVRAAEPSYIEASRRLWDEMVSTKLYLTGGIGSRATNEGFGDPFDLPIPGGYSETCASIASAMWSHRLFLATGDARYLDMVEAVMYNAFHSGWSLDGDQFFYPNPLASRGATRPGWFACACCPPNVCRFVPAIPGYAYATGLTHPLPGEPRSAAHSLYVNLYIAGTASIPAGDRTITVQQRTSYPWDGQIELTLTPDAPIDLPILLRIPGWATGTPLPGGLYSYADHDPATPTLRINGEPADLHWSTQSPGFIQLRRSWQPGDTIELSLPMAPRLVLPDDRIAACRGRAAIQRGPIVYCLEQPDNPGADVRSLVLDPASPLTHEHRPDLLGGVTVIHARARAVSRANPRDPASPERTLGDPVTVTAIPYFAWANRSPSPMTVWIASDPQAASPAPAPTIARRATATASFPTDTSLLSDQFKPTSSASHEGGHCHWWPRKGTVEWVQYDFAEPTRIAGIEVYWFDDTGRGECRVPQSCRVLANIDGQWREVAGTGRVGLRPDTSNRVTFEPVLSRALRLEIQSQPGWAGGIHEWHVVEAPEP